MSEIKPVAVCVIEVPDGEQLAHDYPGYKYRQNLQLPPGDHPVYTADALAAAREEGRREGIKEQVRVVIPTATMEREFSNHHRMGFQKGREEGRQAGLEEAFQACEDLRVAWLEKHGADTAYDAGRTTALANAGDAIRALKGSR